MRFLEYLGFWGVPPATLITGPQRGDVTIGDALAGSVALGESAGRVAIGHSLKGSVAIKDSL